MRTWRADRHDPRLLRDRRHQYLPDLPALRAHARPAAAPRNTATRSARARRRWRSSQPHFQEFLAAWAAMKRITRAGPQKSPRSSTSRTTARGVARIDGKTVFVADALPGERVELARISAARSFDEAVTERVLEAVAPIASTPRCAHFGVCGGCALQHLDPARSSSSSRRKCARLCSASATSRRLEWLPPLLGRGLELPPARGSSRYVAKKGAAWSGFARRRHEYIADVQRCEVLAPPVDSLVGRSRHAHRAAACATRAADRSRAVADNAVELVLRAGLDRLPRTISRAARSSSVTMACASLLQPAGYDTIAPLTRGRPLDYRLPQFDLKLRFRAHRLRAGQRRASTPAMVARAIELLERAGETACSTCTAAWAISRCRSRAARHVVGVEGDAGLVARARQCGANGIGNVEFVCRPVAQPTGDAPWARGRYDKVLLDPPRAGAREVLSSVAHLARARAGWCYISCHTGAWRATCGHPVHEHGFRLRAAGVMDMFPHTTHVESWRHYSRERGALETARAGR